MINVKTFSKLESARQTKGKTIKGKGGAAGRMGLGTQSAVREGSRRTEQEAGTRGREGGGRKGRGRPWAPLPPPCPPSSLLRSRRQGDGTSRIFWPVKGQLVL